MVILASGAKAGSWSRAHGRATRAVRAAVTVGALALGGTALADDVRGAWSPVFDWPLIPVHAVLLPDGRVMGYGTDGTGRQTGYFVYSVWNPALGTGPDAHTTLPNTTATDIFCGSQVVLPGTMSVVLAGGDNWTGTQTTNTGNRKSNVFDGATNTLTPGADMNRSRWYSTSITLLNGETYVQGGSGGTDRPEIRSAAGVYRLLSTADTSGLDFMYPRNFIAPDGRVFGYDSGGRMYYVNTSGTGAVTRVGSFTGPTGNDSSAAMFRPGRILQFGGNSNGAVVIDINSGTPVVTPTSPLSTQRRLVNATILADGKVLATGGSSAWNQMTNVNYRAEIWDPATGQWTLGATAVRARLYHSVGILMPDASVLVGGGGAPGPQNNRNAEIYYPPYLFDSNGVRAARPQITAAPRALSIGQTFTVRHDSPTPIARVTLVRTGSATHSWNMSQRFVEATFKTYGDSLAVQAPTRASDAPPGWYLLFLIGADGVPSVADVVSIGVSGEMNPAVTPVLASPGDRAGIVDVPVSIALAASDPNGDTLGYAASGLPPGVSIDAATGVISGAPTAEGSYDVVVAVSDGFNAASQRFLWTVTTANPLVLAPLAGHAPTLAGAAVTFAASTTDGIGTRYSWFLDDGSPPTDWSDSPEITRTFDRPGLYYVTVIAEDVRGQRRTETVVHAVHLPPTANRPAASGDLAYQADAAGDRVWVVNPDNNSVSVLDAATLSRVAEITVGTAPRSLAIAPNGRVWVVNRGSQSISVIDPTTLAIVRTIGLPRASLPYGIAFAPVGGAAFVALEGLGQVQKYNASTFARLATTAVGPNPRHVAVSADGATVYVSRFVTPPLPGEHTVAVAAADATGPRGGEIVALSAATLAVQRTIVLAVSDVVDTEASGSGVPNYLGAAVISPDGTQAFVPSKQDNVGRGLLRNGLALDFQNTVRAISSRLDLATGAEDLPARLDHDNASVASAAAFDPLGVYLFVALETSRQVAVVDAHGGFELFRVDVGLAPQGLAVAPDGSRLYVHNFMSRTVQALDLQPLRTRGTPALPELASAATVTTERLTAQVLLGKQLFYDARDDRLARDDYMSCASCHNDGGHDGRTWDLSHAGEGLRNTASLRGRAAGHGFLHWSGNFDEVQDFEGQIRALAGGTGLMADEAFHAGTRGEPLGDRKTGLSADLDALAAYVASLRTFDATPLRTSGGALTAAALAGRDVFVAQNCAACHAGTAFSSSGTATLVDVGTLGDGSGERLDGPLTGIDPPTLRDAWATAPYLHNGSAPTLRDAILAHEGLALGDDDLANLVAYVGQIGREETSAPQAPGTGAGLLGQYFNNATLSGEPVLVRIERVDFGWGTASPGTGVNVDNFSIRWTGFVEAPATGTYAFQTVGDDGIRLTVGGVRLVDRWIRRGAATDTTVGVNLTAGQRVPVVLEHYDGGGSAVARLRWRTPGNASFVAIPAERLLVP